MPADLTLDRKLAEFLRRFARTMATDFPIQAILDELVAQVVEMLPVTAAGVTLISGERRPRYVAASDHVAATVEQLQTDLREGPCLLAHRSGQSVTSPDLRTDQRFPQFGPAAVAAGLLAVFTFPLRHDNQVLGALDLYSAQAGALRAEAQAAAEVVADVASAYLINAQGRRDLKEAWDRARRAALYDGLTGLPNRSLMLQRIQAEIRDPRRGRVAAVMFVDVDGLKAVNDVHGHATGDELLIAVAGRIGERLGQQDSLGRLSGDEFAVLTVGHPTAEDVLLLASGLVAAMADRYVLTGAEVSTTVSVGVAWIASRETTAERVLAQADTAMYQAKRRGGNGLFVVDDLGEALLDRYRRLEVDLVEVITRGQLHNDYQPVVESGTGALAGLETLIRWTHPELGVVPPSSLIPMAERAGFIDSIGRWVLQQALSDARRWARTQSRPFSLAVNVSPQQLMSVGFVEVVRDVLDAVQDLSPDRLVLEITESVFLRDGRKALQVLGELRELGVTLALDDFGTGYSSLSYLRQFPVDILKIDRTFISEIDTDPASSAIVGAVTDLAHRLGLVVVAEGVETAAQRRAVVDLGCDYSQGYYFARPLSAPDVDRLLHRPRLTLPGGS
ncbi:diguanylate cyclase (GGDEF) domain-containing protein [Nakamurella panacisegetis]|uniref:Diguanylate cyclase (GGDEF) domain-containing protein n=1 Tax=Nakamurella panacisegetis TaxID=1090615 RepID=A0A1H0LUS3_9ACTN|nr:GGDEF domain-containing protein [Nakamurella panacisegetis]SDO71914.1 diguanylate cyclase (GGDEF) domain-containing protein [Nakamurella panacisegetis]